MNGLTNSDMDYISFGKGNKILIMLPGLGDGLKTVKGTALFLRRRTENMGSTIRYMSSAGKISWRRDILHEIWQEIWLLP